MKGSLSSNEKCLRECTKGGPPVATTPPPLPKIGTPTPCKPAPDPHGFRAGLAKQGY